MRSLARILILIMCSVSMLLMVESSFSHRVAGAGSYYVASLDMDIDPGSRDFVVTAINDARAVGADHFVLVMNTNGGSGSDMENIISAISDYESACTCNNFTTLIAPVSRHAFSAGAFIAESSTKIYMAPSTTIGSATPIITGIPGEEINSTLTKVKAAFSTYMQEITRFHGRNWNATSLMVTNGVSYGASDALNLHVVDGLVTSTNLDGALGEIGVPSGTAIHQIGVKSQAIALISDPNVDAILFLLGAFAILADLTHPTLILTFVGGATIALALLGLGLFGASVVSIILMMLVALFIFLEIKTHHGISAIIGVVIFIVGFLLIFHTPPAAPPPPGCSTNCLPSVNFFPIGLITYAILGVIGALMVVGSLYLYKIREALGHVPVAYDPKSIIGKEGQLTSDLKAGSVGTANIASEDWTVTGSVDIPKGTRVVVKERTGLKLIVEPRNGES